MDAVPPFTTYDMFLRITHFGVLGMFRELMFFALFSGHSFASVSLSCKFDRVQMVPEIAAQSERNNESEIHPVTNTLLRDPKGSPELQNEKKDEEDYL